MLVIKVILFASFPHLDLVQLFTIFKLRFFVFFFFDI